MADQNEYEKIKSDVLKSLAGKPELSLVEDSIIPLLEARAAQTEYLMATEDDLAEAERLMEEGGELAEEWQILFLALGEQAGFVDGSGKFTDKMPAKVKDVYDGLLTKHQEWSKEVRDFQTDGE